MIRARNDSSRRKTGTRSSTRPLLALLAVVIISALAPSPAAAAGPPVWRISVLSAPTNLPPNTPNALGVEDPNRGLPEYAVTLTNIGSSPTVGQFSVTIQLPPGITRAVTGEQTVTLTPADFQVDLGSSDPNKKGIKPARTTPAAVIPVDVGAIPEGTTLAVHASVSGGGALGGAETTTPTTISSTPAPFDFLYSEFDATNLDGSPALQAGSHPDNVELRFGFPVVATGQQGGTGELNHTDGGLRDFQATLPKGFVVNPAATPSLCTEDQLETFSCPDASQVGFVVIATTGTGTQDVQTPSSPLYNMVPPEGVPAELAFDAAKVGIFVHIDGGVSAGEYRLTASTNDILGRFGDPILTLRVQLWGNPSDASHDPARGECLAVGEGTSPFACPVPRRDVPFLTMPGSCRDSLGADATATPWGHPAIVHTASPLARDRNGDVTPVTGCSDLDFNPALNLDPTTQNADSSSGADADLGIPQNPGSNTLAAANLKKATITLPEGTALNPSAGNGLEGCTEAEIGLTSESPIRFDGSDAACPNASKVGDGTLETPLLSDPLDVDLYVADPNDNPFHTLLSGYLVAHGQGLTIKLAGKFDRDPVTGQITAVFDNNPQLPFSDLNLHFKGGDNGVLVTPPTCGIYTTHSEFSSWSAADPANPTPAETKKFNSTFTVNHAPGGGPCTAGDPARPGNPQDRNGLPFDPAFTAGTVSPEAGSYSPFVLRIFKPDGTQELKQIKTTLPLGLAANLSNIPRCSQAAITPGIGGSANCPAGSKVGTVNVGAGAGSSPFFVTGQPVYLTEGYGGAPFALAIDVHAKAGPFDLGHVVTRSRLDIDPLTVQVSAESEALPNIIQGIPLHIRSVSLKIDRTAFTLNPTSCEAMSVAARLTGGGANFASTADDVIGNVADRFQVGDCAALPFKPRLALRLNGGTKRSGHPALRATVTMPPGNADIAGASVALPHSEFLDQAHIRTVCTRVQFAAAGGNGAGCPPGSVYGKARAFTPLLDTPLEGPVYLRSSNHPLPDLVVALHGQIDVNLVGRIDSHKGGIRTTFASVPDAPVSKFVLSMQGGKRGLLENSTNLCKSTNRATALFDAQNGKVADFNPVLKNSCKPKKSGKGTKPKRAHR